jgi:hypothetical protein
MPTTRNLAILIFDDVEVLDFSGPFGVFTVANRFTDPPAFNVFTGAEKPGPVLTRVGLNAHPQHRHSDCPQPICSWFPADDRLCFLGTAIAPEAHVRPSRLGDGRRREPALAPTPEPMPGASPCLPSLSCCWTAGSGAPGSAKCPVSFPSQWFGP